MISTGAALGCKPWETMRMTPREFGLMVRGHNMMQGNDEPPEPDMDKIRERLAAITRK